MTDPRVGQAIQMFREQFPVRDDPGHGQNLGIATKILCDEVERLLDHVKELELEVHDATVRATEAEARAATTDTIVLRVEDGRSGEIDCFSDGHSHHYVPTSMAVELEERIHELETAQDAPWSDNEDEWTSAIRDAYPTRSGSHAECAVARQMVSHRHSKGALVALVNWLLVRIKELEDTIDLERAKRDVDYARFGNPNIEAERDAIVRWKTITDRRGENWRGKR